MVTVTDCLSIISDLPNTETLAKELLTTGVTLDTLKKVNSLRPFKVSEFYNKLRVNYNNKKSKLYINIVKEKDDINTVLTTLSSLQLQALLFAEKIEDVDEKRLFLNHIRLVDINNCINNYVTNFNIVPCIKLLRVIKSDLKVWESVTKVEG